MILTILGISLLLVIVISVPYYFFVIEKENRYSDSSNTTNENTTNENLSSNSNNITNVNTTNENGTSNLTATINGVRYDWGVNEDGSVNGNPPPSAPSNCISKSTQSINDKTWTYCLDN